MDEESGLSLFGVDAVPTAGASYTDAKTIAAVQAALTARGYPLVVDGMYGSKTKAAIKKFQAALNMDTSGVIDYDLVTVLRVTPGALPPGVSIQDVAAVQAQAALDAATRAEHANTPSDVQAAAQATVDAAPAQPPQLKQAAQAALAKAKAATTPAQVKAAAADVQDAAMNAHQAVKPSWFVEPMWDGGPPRWQIGLAGVGVLIGIVGLALGLSGGQPKARGWKQGRGWKSEGHRLRHEAAYGQWRDRQNARLSK